MKARAYFYSLGQRAASRGQPRWFCHHQTPPSDKQSNSGYWATVAWLKGFDDQSGWLKARQQ